MKIYCSKHEGVELKWHFITHDGYERIFALDETCPKCTREAIDAAIDGLRYASEPDPNRWDKESM